jgi:hypothetical protein
LKGRPNAPAAHAAAQPAGRRAEVVVGAPAARKPTSEEAQLRVENKYVGIVAVVGFLLMLWLTDGSMIAAFGVLALIAGIGWAARRVLH